MHRNLASLFGRWGICFLAPVLAFLTLGCPAPGPGGNGNGNSNSNNNGNDNVPGQTDDDGDGVLDEDDLCPETATGAEVDDDGCSDGQRDDDEDGVPNADDDCPNTPAGVSVDADGCTANVPGPDADQDGVADVVDQCPNTTANADVDENGCAADQRDTDGDGVNDAEDRCSGTPTGVAVGATGCPIIAPGETDSDDDGIVDDDDTCPDTPQDSVVDVNGCGPTQRDTDGDGVNDDADLCADTPDDVSVNSSGCPDTDGDGVFDNVDDCPGTPAGTQVGADGCPVGGGGGGGGSVCGNNSVEAGEECDPPNGTTCDANCQNTTGGALANDSCNSPTALTGTLSQTFTNSDATTDGRNEPGQCVVQGYTQVDSDIWYCYTATCTEQVIVSLCGSSYDTKMMIYNGCGCPAAAPIACSDDTESTNNCGTGTDSRASFSATAGEQYMVRIGGFRNSAGVVATGTGRLSIFCASDPDRGDNACDAGVGNCLAPHANPGCETASTCSAVCNVDQFCCDAEWDSVCAQKADGIVNGFPACIAGTGDCFTGRAQPGCEEIDCPGTDGTESACQVVCTNDPFCCLTEWDDVCADHVGTECGVFGACDGGTGSCFLPHINPGCNAPSCCNAVCAFDPICCTDEWDDVCADKATEFRLSGECQ